ncbi:voltage-dependent T-type calcium channel subunit alpha-1G-like isoform X6 [Convolutriloba macropyga]|uniref:voltage-dependent T-type calcium channel subunit alpha-1G-like isoform X6 n=1 Tax=Convolutriloba macropyga TaxID=536237 RepID=UPI003F51C1B2
MYIVQDSHSFYDFAYFVLLIVIGAFFMLNLCLVVIATQFSETKRRESRLINEQRMQQRSAKTNSSSTTSLSSSFQGQPEIGAGCYDEIVALIGHLFRKGRRHFEKLVQKVLGQHKATVTPHKTRRHGTPIVHKNEPEGGVVKNDSNCGSWTDFGTSDGSQKYNSNLNCAFLADQTSMPKRTTPSPMIPFLGSPAVRETCMGYHDSPDLSRIPTPKIPLASQDNLTLFEMSVCNTPVPVRGASSLYQRKRSGSFETSGAVGKTPTKSASVYDYNKFRQVPSEAPSASSLSCSKTSLQSVDTNCRPNNRSGGNNVPIDSFPSAPGQGGLGAGGGGGVNNQPRLFEISEGTLRLPDGQDVGHQHRQPQHQLGNDRDCMYKQIKQPSSGYLDGGGDISQEASPQRHPPRRKQQQWKFSDVSLPVHETSKLEAGCMRARALVDSDYFMYAIFICILLNTMSMAVEFHQQPELLTNIVETSNLVFSIIFAVEMLLKLLVYGLFGYLKNGYNLFDGFIVIISLIELFGGSGEDGEGSSGLSVLRTFRLLRVLKLVRFMPALRRQLLVMLKTMDNVATFFGLLMLFMFIFSILGMHLFGCKFCRVIEETGEKECDRKNFDSLLWAVITVFQVLTGEEWQMLMYTSMKNVGPYSCLYYVVVMTFGNYILQNLLVALIMEGYKEIPDVDEFHLQLVDASRMRCRKQRTFLITQGAFEDHFEPIAGTKSDAPGNIPTIPIYMTAKEADQLANSSQILTKHSSVRESSSLAFQRRSDVTTRRISFARESGSRHCGGGEEISRQESLKSRHPRFFGDEKKSHASSSVGGKLEDPVTKEEFEEQEKADFAKSEVTPYSKKSTPIHADVLNQQQNLTLEAPNNSTKTLSPVKTTRSSSIACRTLQDVASLEGLARNVLVPPTIIQTAATPPSFFQSLASDLDAESDTFSLPMAESEVASLQTYGNSCGGGIVGGKGKASVVSERSWLSVPEERRGSTPRVTVMCRPYSADYENTYTRCLTNSAGAASNGGGGGGGPEGISNGRGGGGVGGVGGAGGLMRGKRGSIAVAASESMNLCRVLYDYHLENSPYQITYKLPPAVEKRLSFAMKQQISSMSIPRHSTISFASTCSVPPSLPALVDTRRPSLIPSGGGGGSGHRGSKTSSFSGGGGSKHTSDAIQPMLVAPPELVAHLERAQLKSKMKTMTYKLSRFHPCFMEREHYSLYIFPPENRFRKQMHDLIRMNWFDYVILIFILANCAAMAMERPTLPPDGHLRKILDIADLVFTFVFSVEMTVKVIAKGLFIGDDAYVKSGWNAMDGILVSISLIDLAFSAITSTENKIFGVLRVFRLLRTLRPLRVISRAPGLKLVVQTLLSSLRPIGNIVLICCTFFVIFGILGVQLFKGTFYHCKGPEVTTVTNKTECLTRHPDNQWLNKKYNFDNLPQALMSLFVLSSKDGWINIMYSGLDAVGVDKQPIKNYNEWRILYFISFLLLVGFFVLNMFVGVVVENFHKVRAAQQAEEAAYKARLLAHKIAKKKRKALRAPYHTNYGPMRLFIHNLVMSAYFDLAIAAVIIVNVITMSIEHYNMPQSMEHALKIFNYFFTAVFVMESTMKIYALGFFRFMRKRWNKLDLVIVALSILGITLEEADTNFLPINPTIIRVMRVFRIARVFKLLKMAKGVRQLLDTVMQALPQVGNLGLLFFLMFFIFAALGVELFGRIECNEERKCEGLSRHASFHNFGIAYLTLFRIATGDNWNGIMKDTLSTECDSSENCRKNCCVSMVIAPIYFVVFVLMAQFVLVNVVVAVLMKHLEDNPEALLNPKYKKKLKTEESHKQNEENVDKELLFEYMQKLERKEKEREQRKLEKKQRKEERKQIKDGTKLIDANLASANLDSSSNSQVKRASPVPLASTNRPNETRPISIVKPMIEGRPVISTGGCSPQMNDPNTADGASGGNQKRVYSDSSCPVSVQVVDAEVSTHDSPSFKRPNNPNNPPGSGAHLSRMNSVPISASRYRDSSDRESDQSSVFSASPRGSNFSVVVLTRAESEDKGTQTFECRVNEEERLASSSGGAVDCVGDGDQQQLGQQGSLTPSTLRSMRLRSGNSHCGSTLHEFSLPSLEETGDDVESEDEEESSERDCWLSKSDPKPSSSSSTGTATPATQKSASNSNVTNTNQTSAKPTHQSRPGMLTHQSTQQRRTLMGLRRQQRVEEPLQPSDDDDVDNEGERGRSSNERITPLVHMSVEAPSPPEITLPHQMSSQLQPPSGFDSNPNLERAAIGSEYQPIRKRGPNSGNKFERHISRSNTVSIRRMDSLEVPSFHPLGRKVRKKKQQSSAAAGPNNASNESRSKCPPSGTRDHLNLTFTPQLRSRRHLFANNAPSLSLDNARIGPGLQMSSGLSVSIDTDDNYEQSIQGNLPGSSTSSVFLGVNPVYASSHPSSSTTLPKQTSEESQHSVCVQSRTGAENTGEELTPDEHLSSPELPRRILPRTREPQLTLPSSSSGAAVSSRSKFKVDPRSDIPKLRRVPTMVADDGSQNASPCGTPQSVKKLCSSDSHLNSNQQSKAVQVTLNKQPTQLRTTTTTTALSPPDKRSTSRHLARCQQRSFDVSSTCTSRGHDGNSNSKSSQQSSHELSSPNEATTTTSGNNSRSIILPDVDSKFTNSEC